MPLRQLRSPARCPTWRTSSRLPLRRRQPRLADEDDLLRARLYKLGELPGCELDQGCVIRRPQAIALETEVLEPEACLGFVRHHGRAPVLEVLNSPDFYARIVDVDPVVGEDIGSIDHQSDADEVAI